MSRTNASAQLASRLAQAAREIAKTHGDCRAQVAAFGLAISRWDASVSRADFLSGIDQPELIREIDAILDQADLPKLLDLYASLGRNPSVYFYEDFTRACDPKGTRSRGVHYTPPEVVSYILRSVKKIIEERFACAVDETILFDPCCGIGTFLLGEGAWDGRRPEMIGMELSEAACSLASILLPECKILHGDSLEEDFPAIDGKLLAIIGNPPYSGHSNNNGRVRESLAVYREGLRERNPKWLQDDYVKFIRTAQERVERTGRGIVAFITNHSFIFNPTFRAMRSSLMGTFDEIAILDLRGNSKIFEQTGSGEPDENIFPIQMGVAISLMIKTSDAPKKAANAGRMTCFGQGAAFSSDASGQRPLAAPGCRVRCAELRGNRKFKLTSLSEMDYSNTAWRDLDPGAPFFAFTQIDSTLREEYYGFQSVFDFFEKTSVGFVTSRDWFAVDFTREALLARVADLRDGKLATDDPELLSARQVLLADPHWQSKAVEALYRPFDIRWAYLSRAIMERPRLPFMENLTQENVALAIGRAGRATGSATWDVIFCTDRPTDLNLFRRGGAVLLPRHLRGGKWKAESGKQGELFLANDDSSNMHGGGLDEDALFAYIYAILNSEIYRKRYAEFLMNDYPRIPMSGDAAVFEAMSELGAELIAIHLMRTPCPEDDTSVPMHIGGYEIPRKFVEDRKRRALTPEETLTLSRIKGATMRTAELRADIDRIIRENPPWN